MLGKPKYENGDEVSFHGGRAVKTGIIKTVEAHGTAFQSEEPSYDIFVEAENCYYRMIRESEVGGVAREA